MSTEPPPQQPQGQPPLMERLLAAPVSAFLFAACIAVFFLAERSGSTNDTATLIRFGANYRGGVWNGEWWRLFTSMFLHIGLMHLVWNVWAGWSWTSTFERVVRGPRFVFIYVVSGLVGSAFSIIGHEAVSAGASGALFGVIGGTFVLMRHRLGGWRNVWNEPALRRNIVMSILWLAIGPFVGFDSFAHAGGMVAGMALTSGFLPGGRNRLALATFFCAISIAAATRPLPKLHDGWIDAHALSAAWDKGDWERVVALTANPAAMPEFAFARGAALIELGRFSEGEALLPTTADRSERVLYLAGLHERAGASERALRTLDAALEASPRNLSITREKYELLSRLGRSADADRLADQLIGDHPGTALALGLMGRRMLRDGEQEAALDDFQRAVALEPAEWSKDLAMHLASLGRLGDAREAAKRSSDADWLECYLSSLAGDFMGNERVCASLDDSQPSREVKAYRLAGLGQYAEARALLEGNPGAFANALREFCTVQVATERDLARLRGKADAERIEDRLIVFSVTRDLADLGDAAEEAKNSWMWPLLPEEARRALPR